MENDKTVLVNFDGDMSLDQAYLELGKAYYEGGFEDPLPELLPLFDRITRLRSEAAASEAQQAAADADVKEVKPASEESAEMNEGREEAEAPAEISDVPQTPPRPAFCPNCGERLEEGAVFCGNCGYRVG